MLFILWLGIAVLTYFGAQFFIAGCCVYIFDRPLGGVLSSIGLIMLYAAFHYAPFTLTFSVP